MSRRTPCHCIALVVGLISLTCTFASAQQRGTLFFEDSFENTPRPEWSSKTVSATPKGQRRFLGPIGVEAIELNLKDLPRHRFVRLTADAYILRSWDGNEIGDGPDVLMVQGGDRRTLFATTFSIFGLQCFPGWYGIHSAIAYTGAKERNTLGYTFNGEPRDGVYPIEAVFPHTEGALTLRFMVYGNGHISDESWGLDNVKVTLDDVAVPTNEQMEQAWQKLAGDDPAGAVKGVHELVSGEAQAVAFLAGKLKGKSLPFEPPGLEAATVRIRPRAPDPSVTQGLNDPSERQLALAAHVLGIIDTDPAIALRKQIVPEPRDLNTITVVVRESRSRRPIPHLPIRASGSGDPFPYALFTNDDGELTFKFPPGMAAMTYSSPRRTFIPVSGSVDLGNAARMRGNFEILLERGTPIGGTVVDSVGKPVAGAMLKFEIEGNPNPNLWDPATLTDDQGRWTFEIAPNQLNQVLIAAFHPNYAIAPGSTLSQVPYPDFAQLREGKATTIMRPGVPIEGIVRDPDGKPIPDAWVDWGRPRGPISALVPAQSTDTQGRFRYTGMAGQTVQLTAKATGFNVVQKSIRLENATAKVEFTLQPSKRVTGRVVTSGGTPVYGARIRLGNLQTTMMFDIGLSTDRQGRFTWDSAPDEEVTGSVSLTGYPSQTITLRAGPEENLIVLKGPMVIRGKVVDSETGQPVKDFRTSYAMVRSGTLSAWQPSGASLADGTFEIRITSTNIDGVVIRIEADGYLATNSELLPMDGTARQLELKLFSTR